MLTSVDVGRPEEGVWACRKTTAWVRPRWAPGLRRERRLAAEGRPVGRAEVRLAAGGPTGAEPEEQGLRPASQPRPPAPPVRAVPKKEL